MLFASVETFREILRDCAIQECFEIVRIRNMITRIIAMCAGCGSDWYMQQS